MVRSNWPLLYASKVRIIWHLLQFTFWAGIVVGAVLVLTAIGVIGLATRSFFLAGLSWPGAILIGSVAAFFDTRLFHKAKGRLRVPRRIGDTLKARELVSRILATIRRATASSRAPSLAGMDRLMP